MPIPDRRELAAVFAGGALGTLCSCLPGRGVPAAATGWPWPTFTVNLAGAFLLGYFVTRLQERLPLSSYRRPLLGTGLCGGLTTFSTMQVEIAEDDRRPRLGAGRSGTRRPASSAGTPRSTWPPPWSAGSGCAA